MSRRLVLLAVLALVVVAVTSASAAPASVRIKRQTRTVKQPHYVRHAAWPQVSGLPGKLQNRINATLRAAVPSAAPSAAERAAMGKGEVYSEEVDYVVSLNNRHLLSVLYSGLAMPTLDGHIYAAHPTKLIRSLTIDLDTGRAYGWGSLFKPDSGAEAYVSKRIEAALKNPIDERRDFYLTPTKLVVIFPDAPFVIQGAEVPIPVADMAAWVSTSGPLARLLGRR